MIAKKLPRPIHSVHPDVSVAQTRKVDSMSELVAEMLLDADATLPPPMSEPSPASFNAVHFAGRPSQRPLALDLDDKIPEFRSRTGRVVVIALLFVLAIAGGLAAVLLAQN